MPFDREDKRKRNYSLMRSIMDYGMGVLIVGVGILLLIGEKIGFEFTLDPLFRYILSGMFIVYGSWRFYRGYQKKYFTEE